MRRQEPEEFGLKEKFLIGLLIVGFLGFVGFSMISIHQAGLRDDARHEKAKEECQKLDARLGDTLEVKEGPYRGTPMMAVRFGEETITVVPLVFLPISAQSDMQLRFTCDDFKVVKRAK